MVYKDFNGIDIENALGVCSVGDDTKMIAHHAAKLKPQSVLDVGTGTGFIPIYLASLGIKATGTDINSLAIELAQKNAMRNKITAHFFVSDLFDKITERYDLICFNPPFGDSKSTKSAKFLEIIKSIIRNFTSRNSHVITNLIYDSKIFSVIFVFIKCRRLKIIKHFLGKYENFLTPQGKVFLWLHKSEISILENYSYKIIDELNDVRSCLCVID